MSDERDPRVSQRYRELETEGPPRELDQAILAAAHRAADKPHAPLVAPAGRHRWYFALGAAAVLALSIAITVQLEGERPDPEAVSVAQAPLPRVDESQSHAKPQALPESAGVQPVEKPRAPARSAPAQPRERAATLNDAGPGKQAEQRREERASTESVPSDAAASRELPEARPASPAPAMGGLSPYADRAQPEAPERWLERILQLRKAGRHEDAEKELAEFRKRYPDYKLPEAALKRE